MAEIIRTHSTRSKTTTFNGETVTETTEYVAVYSSPTDRMTASCLRDFARALEAAEAPNSAAIMARRSDVGHLTGLSAEWNRKLPEAAASVSAPAEEKA